jgi:hypothetical protein
MAEQFRDVGRGITLCYEEFGHASDLPMLLIMGLGTQMIGWPDEFCAQHGQPRDRPACARDVPFPPQARTR